MNFVRKTALVLITPIFIILLFATAFDMGAERVVNQPNNIKQILAGSGLYNTALGSLLAQSKQITDNSLEGGTISLTNPTIEAAASSTFTPQFLRSNTETVIDSIYSWLNGKIAQPNFSIDLTNAKAQFASTVAQAVATRASSLPVCDAANTPSDFDALSASCLPAGVTPAAAAAEIQGEIVGGKGFLDNLVINANSIKTKGSSQSLFAGSLKGLPRQYQRAKQLPIILATASLLLALAIVFLSGSRRKGLRRVGIILVVVGLFMLAFAWGLNYAVSQKLEPKLNLTNGVLQTDVRNLTTDLVQKIDRNYWVFGALYGVLGALAIGAALLWGGGKPKNKADLEGEGKTKEDRIDLKERDKAIDLGSDPKPKTKPKAKKTVKVKSAE